MGTSRQTQPLESLGIDASLEALRVALGLVFVLRQEEHADGKGLFGPQNKAGLAEQIVARNGGLHTHAVAALSVGGNGAAVREAPQSGQGKTKDFMVGAAVQGRNESDAAGIMIEARAYEVKATRRIATTHSPLYMEFAAKLNKENCESQKSCRVGCLRATFLWHSSVQWPTRPQSGAGRCVAFTYPGFTLYQLARLFTVHGHRDAVGRSGLAGVRNHQAAA